MTYVKFALVYFVLAYLASGCGQAPQPTLSPPLDLTTWSAPNKSPEKPGQNVPHCQAPKFECPGAWGTTACCEQTS